jgi:hypothetical protein
MVNTRSGARQDILFVINQLNHPSQELAMDPTMQQFFTEQMQLIQNLTATVQNLQA